MSENYRSFVELFAEHGDKPEDPDDRSLIEAIACAIYDRFQDNYPDVNEWPQPVRYFYGCHDLMHQIGNGGFAQAAYNDPDLFVIAEEAYKHFQRPKAAAICREAISMLPQEFQMYYDKRLKEYPDLEEVFEHFNDSPMQELDERIPDEFWIDFELQKYARQHRAEIEAMDKI